MTTRRVVVLAGGVGGARLADGLAEVLPPEELTLVVNTGDDFEHLGLFVCPDLDTVTYLLAGLSDETRGWGLASETFRALEGVAALGGPSWFQLGDADIATHLVRSERRRRGDRLTHIARDLATARGVRHRILPMCDAPRPTRLCTREGTWLDFQDFLVRRRGEPRLSDVRSEGTTTPTPEVMAALADATLVVIAPSNPYVSIDPILGLRGVRELVEAKPTVAVSPIVGGRAVKGPLAEMLVDLGGGEASARAVAAHYGSLLDAFVLAPGDEAPPVPSLHTEIVVRNRVERARLAREVLDFAERTLG